MTSITFSCVILLICAVTLSSAQSSCKGRCGAEYYRGYICQCDYTCLSYGECCKDFESQCTTRDSCKGRCGENFRRGRTCSCDTDCQKYKQCCPDYKNHCDAIEPSMKDATDPASTFNEEDNADFLSDDELFDFESDNTEANPVPESTSGYGSSATELLDQLSTEPTQDPNIFEVTTEAVTAGSQMQMTLAVTEPTQADASSSTIYPTMDEASTISIDAGDPTSSGTTPPQPTTAAVSIKPTPPLEPPRGDSPYPIDPEPETEATPEGDISSDAQNTELTVTSTDGPEVTTPPQSTASIPTEGSVSTSPTQDPSTVSTNPVVSSTQDPTPIPTVATSVPLSDLNIKEDPTSEPPTIPSDLEGTSVSVSPTDSLTTSEPTVPTTNVPRPTEPSQDVATEDVTPGGTTADSLNVTPDPTQPTTPEATSKPQKKPDSYKPLPVKPVLAKPSSRPETRPLDPVQTLNVDDPRDYQADDNNDTNLCSGRPVSGVTTLRNGTIVVFRGHFFWFLDRNRVPGPARGITQVWGVPSPIDTVFTRCNCQGKTYIFKGSQYWRFENDVLDPDYPKYIGTGFDGLRGHITAALSVPQYQRRRESVYFFKRGGMVQKYSYQFGTTPRCGKKPNYPIYTVSNRIVRQAVSALGPTINIRTSWRGFPSTITAAVSIPSNREPEGFKYYVFSRSKSYKLRMDGERPAIAAASSSPQSNIFKCPKKD
ncbi:proteoglycan 4b isoform X2 [Cheilinus undulatus]|uniref:proteoglycan 4b isoform X2 n=1 Tax=Cheilinus undulatus TaxID=241271 RepID=UPI001BD2AD73|nr:proteoglycan 4b isoform X2 [Cheilinus undulatus]